MLQAIRNNKIPAELRERFKISEDSQTSSIFGTLLHLPTELIWKLLSEACLSGEIQIQVGKLKEFEFWPQWDAKNTSNDRHVEPDLFLRFEFADVIVEAKKTKQQDYDQWEKEFRAYLNEYGDEEKIVFMLAVGGIHKIEVEELILNHENQKRTCKVFKLKWQKLSNQVKNTYDELLNNQYIINNLDSILRILKTLLLAFEIHGYISQNLLQFKSLKKRKRYSNRSKVPLSKIRQSKYLNRKKHFKNPKIIKLWQI